MTQAHTLTAQPDSIRYAIGCFVAAVLLFAMMDTLIKFLATGYPVPQLMFVRSFVALLLVGGWALARGGGLSSLYTRRPWAHVWRAFAGLISMACFFTTFKLLPLAEAYVLSFAGPLFITALSVPLLGERVGWRRWLAVLVGFAGVVVMANPSAGAPVMPILIGLAAALFYALAALAVRGLAGTETTAATIVYMLLTTTVVSGVVAVPVWVAPTGFDAVLMLAIGCIGGAATTLLTQAFRRGPPSVIAPFEYTGMIWATLFGFLVFNEVPTPQVLAGALIIIGSGLYILHRETMKTGR